MIRTREFEIAGPILLIPEVYRDQRGFFVENVRADHLAMAGIHDEFVQLSQSRSVRGSLRGLHFQRPPGQAKLVRVARGAIYDVIVDIRRRSATFGDHLSLRLDDVDHHQLYIPPGFAHGFCALGDEADVLYGVSTYHDRDLERGLAWDDPALGIAWPVDRPLLSPADAQHPVLADLEDSITDWD